MATEEEADEYNINEVDWGEEPGYSWEDQNYGDGSEEDDQCRESRAEDGYEEGPCRGELDSKPQDHYKNHTINKSYSKPWKRELLQMGGRHGKLFLGVQSS